jgi:cytochrome c oxidase subunit 3
MSTGGEQAHYYVPQPSPYPVLLSGSLFLMALGVVLNVDALGPGNWLLIPGGLLLVYVVFQWFNCVIAEGRLGTYQEWEDRSFRLGMLWFIASEVIFFCALFSILFYEREISVPSLASFSQRFTPWPGFTGHWPTSGPAGKPFTPMAAWGIPSINTLLLLSSGGTITWAHGQLKENRRRVAALGVFLTMVLGLIFLSLQATEFYHAYTKLGLTLHSGVYGATFFLLTGFHGLHVTVGVIMLSVILVRLLKGDFKPGHEFAFEAVSWYWHFVDVVWLLLYVFVYWLQ